MTRIIKGGVFAALFTTLLSIAASAQAVKRTPFDVTNYVMDVTISPADRKLTATTDVTFTPLEDTRNVAFELNGSLKVDTITRLGAPTAMVTTVPAAKGAKTVVPNPKTATVPASTPTPAGAITFVQDQTNSSDLGPHVRIDLGEQVTKGTPVTLRFTYSGVLDTAAGGPLLNKRLAFGGEQGYLMYAGRWFPFHDYAADEATSDITITIPAGYQVVGFSDSPVSSTGGKYRFVSNTPTLPGNFAWGKFNAKPMHMGDWELDFYAKPGTDQVIANYGQTLGKAMQYYTSRWGVPAAGKKLSVIEIDDESLEFYTAKGMLFVGERPFEEARDATTERLEREAAFQWWGQTVGLKSFDDAWISQGLAEYSAFAFRESQDAAKKDQLQRELLEKSLTFEQTASLLRAPATLDDQSSAYQYIMYGKGAFVYDLLRDTLGAQKFDALLRNFLQQYRGKNASIDDFEKLASNAAGQPMRYFFARWVDSTGVPEFSVDYQILRTRGGKFVTRGTVKQNYDNLRLPVEVQLVSEGESPLNTQTIQMDEATADFNIESTGKPIKVNIDPGYKLLRISPDLRVSSIARRGIEQFKEGNYAEAQQQFEEALKLDRSNSWIYYHLGLLFLDQRNYDMAVDNFKAALSGNLNPSWLAVWSNIKMGNAYDAKGDRTRAVAAYKRAEALGDDYDSARNAIKKYMDTPYDPKEKQTVAAN
jgi:aminopeptidase N